MCFDVINVILDVTSAYDVILAGALSPDPEPTWGSVLLGGESKLDVVWSLALSAAKYSVISLRCAL
jgi:hypothetical protein